MRSCVRSTLGSRAVCKACEYKDGTEKRQSVVWQAEETGDGRGYCPSYNLAPTDVTPCIVAGTHFKSDEKQVLMPMVWGMIPRWHKVAHSQLLQLNRHFIKQHSSLFQGDFKKHGMTTHNARFEGLTASKLYSHPLNVGQRCAIVCDGYYEWKTTGENKKGAKQPYFIYAKQREGFKIAERKSWEDQWSQEEGWKGIKVLKLAGIFDSWLSPEVRTINSMRSLRF